MGNSTTSKPIDSPERYQAWSLGKNTYGQQLNGTTDDVLRLQLIKNIKNKRIKMINTMRFGSTFIEHEDGDVCVGGCNDGGTLGVGSYDHIKTVKYLDFKVKLISKGIHAEHVFIQKKDDTLVCAGKNDKKQCGVETESNKHNTWIRGPHIPFKIQSIATGTTWTIFLAHNGIMFGCGSGEDGELGMGANTTSVSTPTIIPTQTKMTLVVAGAFHCVALSQNGNTLSWGDNSSGQCGQKNMWCVYVPTIIPTLKDTNIQSVSCGWKHTICLSASGKLFVTGSNSHGQCGDGTTTDIYHPKEIAIGTTNTEYVQTIQCGSLYTITTTSMNNVFAWGHNGYNQCLVLDDKVKKVLTPTQWTIPKQWNVKHKMVQVIAGFRGTKIVIFDMFLEYIHPKEWNAYHVAAWLGTLKDGKYARYQDGCIEEKIDGGDLADLDEDCLKEYGVKLKPHRRVISQAIQELLRTWNKNDDEDDECDDSKEEMKTESDNAEYNNKIDSNKAVTRVDKGVAMFFGVAKYISKLYKDLDDIDDDERHFRNTFAKQYGYRFVSNAYKNRTWTRDEALAWIQSMRDEILLKNGRIQYNGLIFCGASHGSMHSIICSDGTTLEVARIRSFFASSVKIQFKYLPKIFIFNCCRTPYTKEARGPSESTGAAGYGMTITGREGNPVFGATLSSFVAEAFSKGNKQKLYDIYRSAKKNADKDMGLALQEYDTDVGDVVFQKRQGRGTIAQVDGTAQVADDALHNILEPYGGSMNLLPYLGALRDAGFTNNQFKALTSDQLNAFKMKVFHKKELLKRIAALPQ